MGELSATTDLRPGEPKILEFLADHEPCEQKEIAAGCELNASSVTGILGRMEERGLIERAARDGNRRSLYVSMTEKGREKEKLVEEAFEHIDTLAESGITKKDLQIFNRVPEKMYDNLKREQ